MSAVLTHESERVWKIPVSSGREESVRRHVHAVQIAGLEQRMRHRRFMVTWFEALTSVVTTGAVFSLIVTVAGLTDGLLAVRDGESGFNGFLTSLLAFLLAFCFGASRSLLTHGRRALSRDIEETVTERNRLQFLR